MRPSPPEFVEIFSFLCDTITGQRSTFPDQVYSPRQLKGRMTLDSLKTRTLGRTFQDLKPAFKNAVLNRRLCWTRSGQLGLVPRFALEDDQVVVVPGCAVPFVVRQVPGIEDEPAYQLIGECYVDGIMHGEVIADPNIEIARLNLV